MADGKKTKRRSSSAKVTKAKKSESANVVVLGAQKGGVEKQSATAKATETRKTMEIKMSKASTANNPFDKISNDTINFSKDCSEACAKSGQIFMKGFEDIVGTFVSIMQSSAEKNAKFMKEAMSSKTINELADIQSKIAQANFDDFMSGATKISEISVKILTESAEPVNNQIVKAVQKATEAMAA